MQHLDPLIHWVNQTVTPLSNWFNTHTSNIDFFTFCLVYSLIFLFIGYKYHQKQGWVAENKELLSWK